MRSNIFSPGYETTMGYGLFLLFWMPCRSHGLANSAKEHAVGQGMGCFKLRVQALRWQRAVSWG